MEVEKLLWISSVCFCRFVYAKRYHLTIHSTQFLHNLLVRDLVQSLCCMLLHVWCCQCRSRPGAHDGLYVCVCLEVPLAPMVSLSIPSSLSFSPPSFPSVLVCFTPFSRAQLKRHLPLTHAIALCSEAPIFNPSQGLLYPREIKVSIGE